MPNIQKINFFDFFKEVKLRNKEYTRALNRVLTSGFYVLSKEVKSFENNFAKYLGVKYCVGVANGLEAIQISLMALNIGLGDEVITTPVSAVATTLAILAVGAKPVFADINEDGQIDTSKIEKLITKRTKAILPVDLYGQPCDLIKIREICDRHNLYLVEDACQAHGSGLRGKKLGTYGNVGCFSFYPTKNLGAFGDGGAIVTNDNKFAEAFRQIRDYGQESKYVHIRYGLNSRLDELHAALLNVKLNYLDKDNSFRRKIAERYLKNLRGVGGLHIISSENFTDSNFHLFVIRIRKRNELQEYLKTNGIQTLIHYPQTIPQQQVIRMLKIKTSKCPISEKFVKEILSLPCNPFMKMSDVDYISNKIIAFFSMFKGVE